MQGTRVSDEIIVTGQVSEAQLKHAFEEGFRSVLKLRAPEEEGVLTDEKEQAETAGLTYVNIPVRKAEISDQRTSSVLAEIDTIPKPTLIPCATDLRAGAMAFMHVATRHGLSAEQAMAQAQASGFDRNSEPQLKQFFEHCVDSRPSSRV